MPDRHRNQLWLAAGGVVAVIILAVGWFLLIGPQRAGTDKLNGDIAAAELEVSTLQTRLTELREQDRDKDKYQAELAEIQGALPPMDRISDYVRQLQAAGDAAGVDVTSLVVSDAVEVKGTRETVFALPIMMSATGDVEKLEALLDQIFKIQSRAVLVSTTNLTVPEEKGSDSRPTLDVGLQAFVSPGTEKPAATPSASANN